MTRLRARLRRGRRNPNDECRSRTGVGCGSIARDPPSVAAATFSVASTRATTVYSQFSTNRQTDAQPRRSTLLTLSKWISRLTIAIRCCRASAAIHASFAGIGEP